ncbi:uncharacterized protein [Aegilops tauschii subsp. strangulata]|uniref:uncharacterized protein n=1 Tax=Aegilops tauschii subsp. strangulata TaxID=200361 RepID=UPI003CC86E43
MNRQWMYGDRHTSEYVKGVHNFLEVAEANKQNGFMCCPCPSCGNTKSYSDRKILHTHLLYKGFMPHYNVWTRHGEIGVMMEDIEEEEGDDNYVPPEYGDAAMGEAAEDQDQEPDDVPDDDDLRRVIVDARTQCESQKEKLKFDSMLEDHNKGLYPNCEDGNTKLDTVLELLQWKAEHVVPDKGFEKLLKILKKLPKDNELPDSTYATKKVICPLGLEVQKIHACPNDCILYHGAYEDLNACPVWGALRYKIRRDDPGDVDDEPPRKRIPAKVMWYAPIIPRLKHLFRNEEHAKLMRWHREGRKKDGKLRAPADGSQWRKIERKYWAEFAGDPTNVWKNVYLGHRRFLPTNHQCRKRGKHFKGEADHRKKPAMRTGDHVLAMVNDLHVIFGKGPGGLAVPNDAEGRAPMWKKKSIFWDLPYWKDLEVRSSIDVMHMTKNLCVNLLGFLGVYGNTKDTPEAREDLQRLHKKDGMPPKQYEGPASYTLTKEEGNLL